MTWSRSFWFRTAGFALVAFALLGFATVADELRHLGEFLGVLGVLLSGLALLAASFDVALTRRVPLSWFPVGLGVGLLGGALADAVPTGFAAGLFLGLLLACAARAREWRCPPARPAGGGRPEGGSP